MIRLRVVMMVLAVVAAATVPVAAAAGDVDGDGIPDDVDTVINAGTNVALGQSATQSSMLGNNPVFAAGNAVDGLTGGRYPADRISHTADGEPWWEVDLGAEYDISGINLFNRTDCCAERLAGAEVLLGTEPFGDRSLDDARDRAVWSVPIDAPTQLIQIDVPVRRARYVRVQLPVWAGPYLHLAEVAVFAALEDGQGVADADRDRIPDADDFVANTGTILSTGRSTSQSSVSSADSSATSDLAADGVRGVDGSGELPLAVTDDEAEPWWEIDLGTWASIDGVNLYNRTDGLGFATSGASVLIGTGPFGDVSLEDARSRAVWSYGLGDLVGDLAQIDVPDVVGRYVRVQLPVGAGPSLGLAEVDVIGSTNGDVDGDGVPDHRDRFVSQEIISEGAPASQSSVLWNSPSFVAGSAVDGDTGGRYQIDPFAHTADYEPWWDVDLGATVEIDHINVFNRTDCCGERLGGAVVMIGSTPFGDLSFHDALEQATWTGTIDDPIDIIQLDVPDAVGRYVRVQIPPGGSPYLQLAEVQVNARAAGTPAAAA